LPSVVDWRPDAPLFVALRLPRGTGPQSTACSGLAGDDAGSATVLSTLVGGGGQKLTGPRPDFLTAQVTGLIFRPLTSRSFTPDPPEATCKGYTGLVDVSSCGVPLDYDFDESSTRHATQSDSDRYAVGSATRSAFGTMLTTRLYDDCLTRTRRRDQPAARNLTGQRPGRSAPRQDRHKARNSPS
jgi:hypothetical protein